MEVNSIRAHKLSAIVSRILNESVAFIPNCFCVSAVAVFEFYLMTFISVRYFKGKKYKNCSNVL